MILFLEGGKKLMLFLYLAAVLNYSAATEQLFDVL